MSKTVGKASVHQVYYPEFYDPDEYVSGLGAKVLNAGDLLDLAAQARMDSIRLNGIQENPGVVCFLEQVMNVILPLTGQTDVALAKLKKDFSDEQQRVVQQCIAQSTDPAAIFGHEIGSLSPDRCIEILCNLHKLSVGLEEYEQTVLVDFGIYLAEFYAAWHDDVPS